MFEAFSPPGSPADAVLDVLGGRAATLEAYDRALTAALGRHTAASWGAKLAFDRFPRLAFALSKPKRRLAGGREALALRRARLVPARHAASRAGR